MAAQPSRRIVGIFSVPLLVWPLVRDGLDAIGRFLTARELLPMLGKAIEALGNGPGLITWLPSGIGLAMLLWAIWPRNRSELLAGTRVNATPRSQSRSLRWLRITNEFLSGPNYAPR